mmetsp:Transcript_146287/g.469223  ORF Transcript_146287/g.469223 Transcript_146287/m.469223 type:complete len:285 (-) Transcript_146287:757-1611(-)
MSKRRVRGIRVSGLSWSRLRSCPRTPRRLARAMKALLWPKRSQGGQRIPWPGLLRTAPRTPACILWTLPQLQEECQGRCRQSRWAMEACLRPPRAIRGRLLLAIRRSTCLTSALVPRPRRSTSSARPRSDWMTSPNIKLNHRGPGAPPRMAGSQTRLCDPLLQGCFLWQGWKLHQRLPQSRHPPWYGDTPGVVKGMRSMAPGHHSTAASLWVCGLILLFVSSPRSNNRWTTWGGSRRPWRPPRRICRCWRRRPARFASKLALGSSYAYRSTRRSCRIFMIGASP